MSGYICTVCGWEGERKKLLRGSKTVEVLIYSTVFFPGPLYSIWRRTGKSNACPNCGVPKLVKLSSNEGYIARKKFDAELGITPATKKNTTDELVSFGNDKPAATPLKKKPVDPEQW